MTVWATARDGQFGTQHGRRRERRADAWYDLPVNLGLVERGQLLVHGAVERRIAAVDPRHDLPSPRRRDHPPDDRLERLIGGADNRSVGPGKLTDLRTDQRIGVEHQVGCLDQPPPTQRQQLRITRSGADEIDVAGHRGSGSEGVTHRFTITSAK